MLKYEKYRPQIDDLKAAAQKEMVRRVRRIRAGRMIKRPYAPATVITRRRYGLPTKRVDLTGNLRYSRKNWRMLDSWAIKRKTDRSVVAYWTRPDAADLYDTHVRRYGNVFRS